MFTIIGHLVSKHLKHMTMQKHFILYSARVQIDSYDCGQGLWSLTICIIKLKTILILYIHYVFRQSCTGILIPVLPIFTTNFLVITSQSIAQTFISSLPTMLLIFKLLNISYRPSVFTSILSLVIIMAGCGFV